MGLWHQGRGQGMGLGHQELGQAAGAPMGQVGLVQAGQAGLLHGQVQEKALFRRRLCPGEDLQYQAGVGLQAAAAPAGRVLVQVQARQGGHLVVAEGQAGGTPAPVAQLVAQGPVVDALGQQRLRPEPAQVIGRPGHATARTIGRRPGAACKLTALLGTAELSGRLSLASLTKLDSLDRRHAPTAAASRRGDRTRPSRRRGSWRGSGESFQRDDVAGLHS